VNLAESGLQPDPLEIAARQLAELHAVSNRPAQAIAVWAHLRLLPHWLERAREASSDPPESAAKAAEWLLDRGSPCVAAAGDMCETNDTGE
jgi:hypothetical protein